MGIVHRSARSVFEESAPAPECMLENRLKLAAESKPQTGSAIVVIAAD